MDDYKKALREALESQASLSETIIQQRLQVIVHLWSQHLYASSCVFHKQQQRSCTSFRCYGICHVNVTCECYV